MLPLQENSLFLIPYVIAHSATASSSHAEVLFPELFIIADKHVDMTVKSLWLEG